MTSSLLEFALWYADQGIKVFPLHGIIDGRCTCGKDCGRDAGKHPIFKGGFHIATEDASQIRKWWSRHPYANIGLRTGNGLMVVDPDGPEGLATLEALVAGHGPLPLTAHVKTSRGWHFYFSVPETLKIPCSSKDGLDVRGDGGYVVAPPSVHVSGHTYTRYDRERKPVNSAASWSPFEIAASPDWAVEWAINRTKSGRNDEDFAHQTPPFRKPLCVADIEAAIAILPNNDLSWDEWNYYLMLLWAVSDGAALPAAHQFSKKSKKYDAAYTDKRWREITRSPPTRMGVGSLIRKVRQFQRNSIPPSLRDNSEAANAQTNDNQSASSDDEALIDELAKLNDVEYGRRRKKAAETLGIPLNLLDKAVEKRRSSLGERVREQPLFDHWAVDQWTEPVDGDALILSLVRRLRSYVVMSNEAALTVALWTILTWVHADAAVHSPILMITSPEAACGKTTLLGIIGFLARRALLSVSVKSSRSLSLNRKMGALSHYRRSRCRVSGE